MGTSFHLTLKVQAIKAAIFCAVGIVLFGANLWLMGRGVAVQQTASIVVVAALFFALGFPAVGLYWKVMAEGRKWAVNYYLLARMVRLFLAILILIVYAFVIQKNLLAFALNLFILYMADMICSTAFSVKMEQQMKYNQ